MRAWKRLTAAVRSASQRCAGRRRRAVEIALDRQALAQFRHLRALRAGMQGDDVGRPAAGVDDRGIALGGLGGGEERVGLKRRRRVGRQRGLERRRRAARPSSASRAGVGDRNRIGGRGAKRSARTKRRRGASSRSGGRRTKTSSPRRGAGMNGLAGDPARNEPGLRSAKPAARTAFASAPTRRPQRRPRSTAPPANNNAKLHRNGPDPRRFAVVRIASPQLTCDSY